MKDKTLFFLSWRLIFQIRVGFGILLCFAHLALAQSTKLNGLSLSITLEQPLVPLEQVSTNRTPTFVKTTEYVADANVADANVADANVADANVADANVADANVADANTSLNSSKNGVPLNLLSDGELDSASSNATPTSTSITDFSIPDVLQDPLFSRPDVLKKRIVVDQDASNPCPPEFDLTQALSLVTAIDIALCHNPQLKGSWAAIKIQAAALGEARATYLPTINGSVSQLHNKTEYPENSSLDTRNRGRTVYANFTWRLLDFGGRNANNEAAEKTLAAALASQNAALQKTMGAVVAAYFDATSAHGAMLARKQAKELAQHTLEATERLELKGAGSRNDTLQAEAAFAKARLAQQRAVGDYRRTLATLLQALGISLTSQINLLAPTTNVVVPQIIDDLNVWLTQAQQNHPAILAARAQRDAAQHKITALRSEGMLSLDFVSNYYKNGFPNQGLQATKTNTTTVGVTLNIPLFAGFGRTYKIRGAQAQAEQSEAQLLETENQILTEIVKAHTDSLTSLQNLSASETLLKAAQAAVESAERRYFKGVASILDLLTAQSTLADAQQERVRTQAEWHSARLRLLANSGLLEPQHLP